jgi:hypothetical protein
MADRHELVSRIDSLLRALADQPGDVETHRALRDAALHYKAGGGPPLGMFSSIQIPSRDVLQRLLHSERRWAFDAGSSDKLLAVLRAVHACATARPEVDFAPVLNWLHGLLRAMRAH